MTDQAGPYTADQLEAGIHNALAAKDVRAAVDILEALATIDLPRAIAMHKALTDAVTTVQTLRAAGIDPATIIPG